ncbi:MAG: DUF503 domain-containing protein [Acidobacteriota bacterium]
MLVGVALFEIHIAGSRSLKEKRTVVRSLRDQLRRRFEVSAAEVALQELHQRARIGVAFVVSAAGTADPMFASLQEFVEGNSEGRLVGWTQETLDFDPSVTLGIPNIEWREQADEEDS